MPLHAHTPPRPLSLRVFTDTRVDSAYPLYRISAGRPTDTDVRQFEPDDFRHVLYANPDGVWALRPPDSRWNRFGVHAGQFILLDVDAAPEAGELIAAKHPGCDEPHLQIYRAGFPPDSDVIGVARLKVTVEVVQKFVA